MSTSTERVQVSYGIRKITNVVTGETGRRAFPISNGMVTLDRFCKILSEDYGLMAGRESHVKGTVVSIMEAIVEEMKKGNSVTIDNYLRFIPSFRGPVDPATGKPTDQTELCVAVQSLKKMKLDQKNFDFVIKDKSIVFPKMTEVYACILGAERNKIVRGKDFQIGGKALYFDAAMGDTVSISYKSEEEEVQSIAITPTECTPINMRFAFPAALAEVDAETELEITLRTRSGVADGAFYIASTKAILIEA